MNLRALVMVCVLMVSSLAMSSRAAASSDVVLEWNELSIATMLTPPAATPFGQARFAAIVQLAVFEAVNAITHDYEPYLGTITAPSGASAEAAAVAAAHRVLRTYFMGSATTLDARRATSLALIADGQAKTDGIATGEAAAAAMIANRADDGSSPLTTHAAGTAGPGVWQATPSCASSGGAGQFFNWQNVTPFGIPSAAAFVLDPPPALTSERYAKDYNEVLTVGSMNSTARPQDRSDVARIYRDTSPTNLLNSAARQVATAQGRSLSENARALALLNMATSDGLVVSFATKYTHNFWRPETAIRGGATDGNSKTTADSTFAPYITTPCFPSFPSNHASGTNGGAEVLRRMYGAGGHSINISSPNPVDAAIVLHYTTFKAITDDVDDARVYGGIHFRFDQEAGGRLGRDIATYIVKNNLRPMHGHDTVGTATDTTKPTFSSISVARDVLTVTFDEPVCGTYDHNNWIVQNISAGGTDFADAASSSNLPACAGTPVSSFNIFLSATVPPGAFVEASLLLGTGMTDASSNVANAPQTQQATATAGVTTAPALTGARGI